MTEKARDAEGRIWEYVNGRWRPYTGDVSTGQAMMIGAGETFTNIGRGVADAGAALIDDVSPGAAAFRSDLASRQESDQRAFAELQGRQPVATTIGQLLPYLAAAPIGGTSVPAQMLIEGGIGAAEYGSLGERFQRGGTAALLAGGGGVIAERVRRALSSSAAIAAGGDDLLDAAGAARVEGSVVARNPRVSPLRRLLNEAGEAAPLSEAEEQAARRLAARGYKFEPGMVTNNRAARQLSASAKRNPIFANIVQQEVSNPNFDNYTRTALRALGETSDEITDSTIMQVEQRLAQSLEDITERTPTLKGANKATERLKELQRKFTTRMRTTGATDPEERRLAKLIAELEKRGDSVPTRVYADWRSDYRAVQRSGMGASPDPNKVSTAGDVVEVLDEWFGKNVDGTDAREFFKTIQQFRLLNALDKPQVLPADLKLRPLAMAREMRKSYNSEFWKADKFGSLEQYPRIKQFVTDTRDLAKFPEVVNDSGTATNLQFGQAIKDPLGTGSQLALRGLVRQWVKAAQPQF